MVQLALAFLPSAVQKRRTDGQWKAGERQVGMDQTGGDTLQGAQPGFKPLLTHKDVGAKAFISPPEGKRCPAASMSV